MNFLTIDKVNKIIELANLVYSSKTPQSISDMELTDSNTQAKELIEFLIERQTLNTPINTLSEYINNLSSEETAEAIALMVLGRGDSGRQPSDFLELVKEAQGVERHYLVEKSLLAKYLRSGLEKLNLH
ncbi:hypothetical protein GXM_08108 [Nostoc sphaeroides CCNUC1]|uniref:DUF3775 domain-containing protein n=2 Tax=Nostoc sphaeroides TaxID=446679 RepID=A0A5P8WDA0_9NOSO|nr:hypothetical protein GXM_08108 [Nostoc sphaeroides CCNUC1]